MEDPQVEAIQLQPLKLKLNGLNLKAQIGIGGCVCTFSGAKMNPCLFRRVCNSANIDKLDEN